MSTAQINKPSLSPRVKTEQNVGMVHVSLDYGQPNKQNRKIFGGLIPYEKLWRTGANASTKISFDKDVKLGGANVPAGLYSIYSIPGEEEWTVILHKNTELWGSAGYDQKNDLVRLKVPVTKLNDELETFTIHFENFNTNGGDLIIAWENAKISIPLFVDSDAIILQEIESKINVENGDVKAQTYFEAAQFYHLKGIDLETAMKWYGKAIELRPNAFWYIYYKAELAFLLEDYGVAREYAEKCLEAAKQSSSTDYGYIAKCALLLEQISSQTKG